MDLQVPVIGILRGIDSDFFTEVMQASFGVGLQALEITMNTVGALDIVRRNRPLVPDGAMLGMGTIRNLDEAQQAVAAGAMFLVTPNLDEEVVRYGVSCQVPVVAGALTPTEVYRAWAAGAAMVKVFPCGAMGGASYIKSLRGPFDHIPLVAVGGVSLATLADYFAAGAHGVGVSTSLFGPEALAEKNINELTKNVKNYIWKCSEFRKT